MAETVAQEEQIQEIFQEFLLCCRYGEKEGILKVFEWLESVGKSKRELESVGKSKRELESVGKSKREFVSRDQCKAIFNAAGNGHDECLKTILLNCKPALDVNCENESGNTPLHWAALNGHEATCQTLLANGAIATKRNNQGLSPATLAEQRSFMNVANLILNSYDPDELEDEGAQEGPAEDEKEDVVFSSRDAEFIQESREE